MWNRQGFFLCAFGLEMSVLKPITIVSKFKSAGEIILNCPKTLFPFFRLLALLEAASVEPVKVPWFNR